MHERRQPRLGLQLADDDRQVGRRRRDEVAARAGRLLQRRPVVADARRSSRAERADGLRVVEAERPVAPGSASRQEPPTGAVAGPRGAAAPERIAPRHALGQPARERVVADRRGRARTCRSSGCAARARRSRSGARARARAAAARSSCEPRPPRPSSDAAVSWTSVPPSTSGRSRSGSACTSRFRSGCASTGVTPVAASVEHALREPRRPAGVRRLDEQVRRVAAEPEAVQLVAAESSGSRSSAISPPGRSVERRCPRRAAPPAATRRGAPSRPALRREVGAHVRRRGDDADPVGDRVARHLAGCRRDRGPVVDGPEDVRVEVDHDERREPSELHWVRGRYAR